MLLTSHIIFSCTLVILFLRRDSLRVRVRRDYIELREYSQRNTFFSHKTLLQSGYSYSRRADYLFLDWRWSCRRVASERLYSWCSYIVNCTTKLHINILDHPHKVVWSRGTAMVVYLLSFDVKEKWIFTLWHNSLYGIKKILLGIVAQWWS